MADDIWRATEVILPVLAILGVILMLGALAVVSLLFARAKLQDETQALGLPEGSIRAVIALSLIVLLAILTVYLYSNISKPSLTLLEGLTKDQKNEFAAAVPKERIVGIVRDKVPIPGDEPGTERYTIYVESRNPAGDDFAKQLLVLLGTLVTSIASFYFGSKAGAAGALAAEGETPVPLAIRGISPATRKADGSAADMEITGDNLGLVKEVKIVSGGSQIVATDVLSNDSLVKFKLTIPAGSPTGTWNVMVTDNVGQTAELSNGIDVTA